MRTCADCEYLRTQLEQRGEFHGSMSYEEMAYCDVIEGDVDLKLTDEQSSKVEECFEDNNAEDCPAYNEW